MAFRVTFETEVGAFDARMSRRAALDWLHSRGYGGFVSGSPSGPHTPLPALSDDDLGKAIAVATRQLVEAIGARGSSLTVRNKPDDERPSWVSVRATSIHAVVVRVTKPRRPKKRTGDGSRATSGSGESEFPFSTADKEWLRELLDGEDPADPAAHDQSDPG